VFNKAGRELPQLNKSAFAIYKFQLESTAGFWYNNIYRAPMLKSISNIKLKFFTIVICLALILPCARVLFAQNVAGTVDELTQKKDEKQRQLLEIRQQLNSLQSQINIQRTKIASLKNEIKLFDLQIQQTQRQIEALDAELEVTNMDIAQTINEIADAENRIKTKLDLLEELIRQISQNDKVSPLKVILMRDSFSDILNIAQNTITFQNRNQQLLTELKDLKKSLDEKQAALSKKKSDLEELKLQSQATRVSLQAQQRQKTALLAATRGQESRYQSMLTEVSAQEAQIGREIYDMDLAIRQKLGDKTLPPVSGALIWPMEGILTQGYGNTGFRALGYSFHNGIDIAAPPDTPIHAAADGIVYATGTGKTGYGNWVVLKHTLKTDSGTKNIYTLYAHFSKILVSSGKGVLAGDTIGLQGNTGNTTKLLYGEGHGYHLHFTIFDEEGFDIKDGAYANIFGPYKIPYGYTYNPMDFLK
jgi:murein DD-endopeptidase MepM/ murein hydrolase activator NlpD